MQVSGIDWKNYEVAIPAFLMIILMPFAFSITAGIGGGFIAFVVIKIALGKIKEIHALMWLASVLFVAYFTRGPIGDLLGAF
jgi:AGZA family xanthine/uracil permease-like MFS transporter